MQSLNPTLRQLLAQLHEEKLLSSNAQTSLLQHLSKQARTTEPGEDHSKDDHSETKAVSDTEKTDTSTSDETASTATPDESDTKASDTEETASTAASDESDTPEDTGTETAAATENTVESQATDESTSVEKPTSDAETSQEKPAAKTNAIDQSSPWYIRVLVGFSAWIAALLLFIFFVLTDLFKSGEAKLVLACFLCIGAIPIRRHGKGPFIEQLTLVSVLTGQALFCFGFIEVFKPSSKNIFNTVCTILIAFQVLYLIVYVDKLYRFLSVLFAACCIYALCVYNQPNAIYLVLPAFSLAATGFWLGGQEAWKRLLRRLGITQFSLLEAYHTIGYSLVFSFFLLLIGLSLFTTTFRPVVRLKQSIGFTGYTTWLYALALALIWLYTCLHIRKSLVRDWGPVGQLLTVGFVVFCLASYREPGILGASLVLTIGFYRRDLILLVNACVFLLVFAVFYYYSLNVTLLTKSLALFIPGVVLLALRAMLRQMNPQAKEAQHA